MSINDKYKIQGAEITERVSFIYLERYINQGWENRSWLLVAVGSGALNKICVNNCQDKKGSWRGYPKYAKVYVLVTEKIKHINRSKNEYYSCV